MLLFQNSVVTKYLQALNREKMEIDNEVFDSLFGYMSHPNELKKKGQKIALRVISQFGEETMKVLHSNYWT